MSAVGASAIAASFSLLHDPRVGIIAEIAEAARESAAPDFIHYSARTCATTALGGVSGPLIATAAAPIREEAVAKAVERAIARYAAALYDRSGLPLASAGEASFPTVPPGDFRIYSQAQLSEPGFPYVPFDSSTPVRWAGVVDLAKGESIHLPAAFVWHPYFYLRRGGDLPIAPPTAAGLACREGVAAAALAGLCEVVARDAFALFWQSMTPPPQVRMETLPRALGDIAALFEATGDRVAILDITTNNRLPSFAAVVGSDQAERPAFAFAAVTALDPVAAIREALCDLAEVRRLAGEAKRRRPAASPANAWEDVIGWQDHLAFGASHDNRAAIAFMLASEDRRNLVDYENAGTGKPETDLEISVSRVVATGHNVYAANLTSEDIGALGLNVCRVVVPGYQPIFAGHNLRALGGDRLYDVPQKLGYRGIPRASNGNPAPHPFM